MEDVRAIGEPGAGAAERAEQGATSATRPDLRRSLQLALGVAWIVDAVLQAQPFMLSKAFGRQLLAGSASGNPAWVADSVTWAAAVVARHPVAADAAFAAVQLLLGVGIAWRPTIRPALAASVGWSVAVWWFGEGFGGVLTGGASPVTGAPGAALLYALLAVALWPADRDGGGPFVAAGLLGAARARLGWLALWDSLVYFAMSSTGQAPQGLHDTIVAQAAGEPRWLAAIIDLAAAAVAHRGPQVSAVLAAALGFVAVGVFLPPRLARVSLALAILLAAALWVGGQALGGILTGEGTDPNSGPLLALLAVAYWPRRRSTTGCPVELPADLVPAALMAARVGLPVLNQSGTKKSGGVVGA